MGKGRCGECKEFGCVGQLLFFGGGEEVHRVGRVEMRLECCLDHYLRSVLFLDRYEKARCTLGETRQTGQLCRENWQFSKSSIMQHVQSGPIHHAAASKNARHSPMGSGVSYGNIDDG